MELWSISLIGGILVLDTAAVLQILISQPLVAGAIIGWLMGDVTLGLEAGLLFQLLWLNQIPVGAAKIPAGNLATIISIILLLRLQAFAPESGHLLILLVLLYALLISFLGTKLVTAIRSGNVMLLDRISSALDRGKIGILGVINFLAILLHFISVALAILVGVLVGQFLLEQLIPQLPANWNEKARLVEFAIFGVGIGFTAHLFKESKQRLFLAIGTCLGAVLFWVL